MKTPTSNPNKDTPGYGIPMYNSDGFLLRNPCEVDEFSIVVDGGTILFEGEWQGDLFKVMYISFKSFIPEEELNWYEWYFKYDNEILNFLSDNNMDYLWTTRMS